MAKVGRYLAEIGQTRPNYDKHRPSFAEVGQIVTQFGPDRSTFCPHRPMLAGIRPKSDKTIAERLASCGARVENLFGNCWASLGQLRSSLGESGVTCLVAWQAVVPQLVGNSLYYLPSSLLFNWAGNIRRLARPGPTGKRRAAQRPHPFLPACWTTAVGLGGVPLYRARLAGGHGEPCTPSPAPPHPTLHTPHTPHTHTCPPIAISTQGATTILTRMA